MNASIHREGCISCGLCAEICPAVFHMCEDGLADVHRNSIPREAEADAAKARESCPVSVITVEE